MPAEVGAAIVLTSARRSSTRTRPRSSTATSSPRTCWSSCRPDRLAACPRPPARPVATPRAQAPPRLGTPAASDGATPGGGARQTALAHADRRPPARALGDQGVVIKITDFGIAKILDAQSVTSTGQVLGSPAHMAPEQIEGGDVDPRTDVFALGVLMYECLVGHLPFEGKNPAQVLRRVLEGELPRPPTASGPPSAGAGRASSRPRSRASRPSASPRRGSSASRSTPSSRRSASPTGAAEIAAYFADPAGLHRGAHGARLVPRLTARGEAARKAGDVWGAAAD